MRNLLALSAAALLAFVVVGWFLGWYHVTSAPTSDGREYKVDLNAPKITEDINKGKEKLREILHKENAPVKQQVSPSTSTAPAPEPPVTGSVPATFRTTDDGSFIFPGAPASTPPPLPTPPAPGPRPLLPPQQ